MRKLIFVVFVLLITVFTASGCGAESGASDAAETNGSGGLVLTMKIGEPIMTVNGVETEIDPGRDTTPIIVEGRTFAPIRAVVEAMGGAVYWDEDSKNVILAVDDKIVVLTVDNATAFAGEEKKILDAAPTIINGRTMLPVRFACESLGFDVDWDVEQRLITITKRDND